MSNNEYSGIWVFAEQENGALERTVYELLAKAAELKAHSEESVTAVLLGHELSALAQPLFEYGADEVILAESEALKEYSARPYQSALTRLVQKYRPSILLYGATPLGRDLAPRMMVALNTGLTADVIDLGYDSDGVFVQTTPAYGGKILAHIAIPEARPQMATVHPQTCAPLERTPGARGRLILEELHIDPDPDYELLEQGEAESAGPSLSRASAVVAGGRGIKTREDLAMLEELSELIGGQLASSRPLVDNGWLPHSRQIGQSGATVTPELIINVAISGSVQYQLGMQSSKCVIAINQDSGAPIFDIAGYGAVADYRKLVPALIKELKS